MANTPVPAPLEQAILSSSKKYGVPHDLLEGIWRIESNSTYPNPYSNGTYGGLFGTKDIYGPTQEQADLAASILASDIKMASGSIAGGLSYYSGGGGQVPPPPKHGYDQVPGEVTFGFLNNPSNVPPPSITGGGGGSPGAQSVSLTSGITGDITGSVKEAFIRVAEILLALFLGYLGFKALQAALGRGAPIGDAARFATTWNLRPGAAT